MQLSMCIIRGQELYEIRDQNSDITLQVVGSIYPAIETKDATSCIVLRSYFGLQKVLEPEGQIVEFSTTAWRMETLD